MTIPRYIANPCWCRVRPKMLRHGDYVVATKYNDGDPGDQFCVGFYHGAFDHFGQTRHLVRDEQGAMFRANGFRRAERVSARRGNWLVAHLRFIERMKDRHSVWHWVRAPWSELEAVAAS